MKKADYIWIVVIVVVLLVAGYLILGNKASDSSSSSGSTGSAEGEKLEIVSEIDESMLEGDDAMIDSVRVIEVNAKRWDFEPAVINVQQGETVTLKINNLDTNHGINIPDLGVVGNDEVTFTAETPGTYTFFCNTFCGQGHKDMTGTIVVE